jgi:Tn3 transposase DDE domain
MRASYSHHYRRAIPALLQALEFRSNNQMHQPVIRALDLIKQTVEHYAGASPVQICLVYTNTLMIQRVLTEPDWTQRMLPDDLRALTPLIYAHVTPYYVTFRLGILTGRLQTGACGAFAKIPRDDYEAETARLR